MATGSLEIRAATPAELPAIRDLLDASLDCDPDARSLIVASAKEWWEGLFPSKS